MDTVTKQDTVTKRHAVVAPNAHLARDKMREPGLNPHRTLINEVRGCGEGWVIHVWRYGALPERMDPLLAVAEIGGAEVVRHDEMAGV